MKHVRVYRKHNNEFIHEYNIDESISDKTGAPVYKLIRYGGEWSESARGKVVLSVEETGNGYKFSNKIGNEIGYDFASELYILLRYLDMSEKIYSSSDIGGLYSGEIQIIKQYETINI